MDDGERRAMWKGFGDGLAQAFEMAVIPVVFALGGLALDRWLGTVPVITTVLVLVGMIGVFLRAYYWYLAGAEEADAGRPWARTARRSESPTGRPR